MAELDAIIAHTQRKRALREERVSLDELKRACESVPDPLRHPDEYLRSDGATSVIAEIKRASPWGVYSDIEDPTPLAQAFERGGAAMLSVVTESSLFNGSYEDLSRIRAATELPLVCKDIILSAYQLFEARRAGADAVLLIAQLLSQPALEGLLERAQSLGMSVIVETHSRLDALRALEAGAVMIGVNARNLSTGVVDRHVIDEVIDVIPTNVLAIAESGVRGPRDVFEYARAGADAVLVGEALMRSDQPEELVAEMVSAGHHPSLLADRRMRVRAAHKGADGSWNDTRRE